ncbi:MAG: hypothetical protein AB7S26_22145 [Sandaracinaceae bacterium]
MLVGALRVAPPAHAQAPSRADGAYDEGRLDDAAALYGVELESGRLEPAELAHVHLRLAELARLASLDADAEQHLRTALSLTPDAEPPEGLAELAARIRAEGVGPVRVLIAISDPSTPARIEVTGAPQGLVRTLMVRTGDAEPRAIPWDGTPREEPSAPSEVRALDRFGNVVARAGRARASSPPPEEPVPPRILETEPGDEQVIEEEQEEDDEPSALENPWLWIAVGLVVVGAGVAIGVSASGERYIVGAPIVR